MLPKNNIYIGKNVYKKKYTHNKDILNIMVIYNGKLLLYIIIKDCKKNYLEGMRFTRDKKKPKQQTNKYTMVAKISSS